MEDIYDLLLEMLQSCKTLPLNKEARLELRGNEIDFVLQTYNSEIIVTVRTVRGMEKGFMINDQVKVKLRDESHN